MDIDIDYRELEERAQAHAKRMYADNDPRQRICAAEYMHREWLKMITPPAITQMDRIESLIKEIRDLLMQTRGGG